MNDAPHTSPVPGSVPPPQNNYYQLPQKKRPPVALMLVGLVVLVVAALAALWYFGPLQSFYAKLQPGFALKDSAILASESGQNALQTFGLMGLSPLALGKEADAQGTPADYAHAAGVRAAIMVAADGRTSHMMMIAPSPRQVASDNNTESGLALSADGTRAAYATLDFDQVAASSTAKDWKIHLVDLPTSANSVRGTGVAPQFFRRDGVEYLAFTTATGLHVLNLKTDENMDVPLAEDGGIAFPILVSRDGQYLAYRNPVGKQYALFSIKNTASFAVKPLQLFPAEIASMAFADDGTSFYTFKKGGNGITLSAYALAKPDAVLWTYDLPGSLVKFIP